MTALVKFKKGVKEMRLHKTNTNQDRYLKYLLKLVKTKGVLVKKMKVGDSFTFDRPADEDKYKKNLGTVPVKDFFGKKIKNVYLVYEDYDGSIKYYDYPQR